MPWLFTLLLNMQMSSGRGTQISDEVVSSALRTMLSTDSRVRLFQTSLTPNFNTPNADFFTAEADFTGYTSTAIAAWTPTITDPDGGKSFQSGIQSYVMSATTVTNNIGGWFVTNGDNDVIGYGQFDTPVTIATVGAGIAINIEIHVK